MFGSRGFSIPLGIFVSLGRISPLYPFHAKDVQAVVCVHPADPDDETFPPAAPSTTWGDRIESGPITNKGRHQETF